MRFAYLAPAFLVARYTPDGSRDAVFGVDGFVTVDFTGLPAAASGLLLQPGGKLIATGQTQTGAGGVDTYDFATARLQPDGTLNTTWNGDGRSVADAGDGVFDSARGAALAPDGDVVVVGYTLAAPGAVRLALYDLLGRAVVVLVDGEAPAGRHEAPFDARALPAGVYLVRMAAGDVARAQRVTLLR